MSVADITRHAPLLEALTQAFDWRKIPKLITFQGAMEDLDKRHDYELSRATTKKERKAWAGAQADGLRLMCSTLRVWTTRSKSAKSRSPAVQRLKELVSAKPDTDG